MYSIFVTFEVLKLLKSKYSNLFLLSSLQVLKLLGFKNVELVSLYIIYSTFVIFNVSEYFKLNDFK